MLFRGERPLRDFSDAGLSGAWPALSYLLPMWAQQVGGRTLLPEAYLTVGALAIAYAIVFLLAWRLSGRMWLALLAALLAIITGPKLYNYSKVLMLTLGAAAIYRTARRPTRASLAGAGVVTAVAALFRHDFAVYIGVGMTVALLVRDPRDWRATLRHLATYAAVAVVLLLPTAAFVQLYQGVPEYLRAGLESSQIESRRTQLQWPVFDTGSLLATDSLLALSYYLFWLLLVLAAVVLAARMVPKAIRPTPEDRATGFGLLALAAIVNVFFLRGNLGQRFGDAIVPTVLIAAWTVAAAGAFRSPRTRIAAAAAPPLLLAVMLVAVYQTGEVGRELESAALTESFEKARERFDRIRAELLTQPPADWRAVEPIGTLRAARYVAECTTPDDYVLVAAYAPEIPVFARRRFAAGQPVVALAFYTSAEDQQRALARLRQQSVPIILALDEEYDEEFASDYPLLARYVDERYRIAGTIPTDDGDERFRVLVDRTRQPRGIDRLLELPCFR